MGEPHAVRLTVLSAQWRCLFLVLDLTPAWRGICSPRAGPGFSSESIRSLSELCPGLQKGIDQPWLAQNMGREVENSGTLKQNSQS